MSAEEVYHSTTYAHLSEPDQDGDTDIDESCPTEESGPNFIHHKDKGMPPRALLFITTATDRPAVATISTPFPPNKEVIEVLAGESVDLTIHTDVNVPPS